MHFNAFLVGRCKKIEDAWKQPWVDIHLTCQAANAAAHAVEASKDKHKGMWWMLFVFQLGCR